MNFSYDYEELIEELKSDLTEGLTSMGDKIKIVRGQKVANHYYPIIDYYYDDNEPDEKYEVKFQRFLKKWNIMTKSLSS
ncbi:hypothetical protein O0550_23695 [Brevibacillus halotolerans]|uniref:hypothetical protein n=1 Tax=Brevibacillus TaxID=55080 RepID=UPI00215D485E|nr:MULTISPECIES: hypothetical protein [Brevibacillus]MCR8966150.1 hypothetical protein [Brevibacillus laterosporus]MCZ0838307.1 hypothetical protein [Brevibacillus halotolerans]